MSAPTPHPRVRVILAAMPQLMAAAIRAPLEGTGFTVTEVSSYQEARDVTSRYPGAVVVVPAEQDRAALYAFRLGVEARVLTVVGSRQQADLFEVRLLGTDVGGRGVVEAIQAILEEPRRDVRRA